MASTGDARRALMGLLVLAFGVLGLVHAQAAAGDSSSYEKAGVVLPVGSAGAWDGDMVESPSVVRDPDSGKWAMVYTGYGTSDGVQRAQVGLAYSRDAIHWKRTGQPILGPSGIASSPDVAGTTGPVLLRHGGRWILYYIGLTSSGYEGGAKTINYATSASLAGPWKRHGVLVAAAGDGWRAKAVWHVSVVRRGAEWFMFFNATGADDRERIGYATADRPTGPWTVDDAQPPLLEPRPGKWDGQLVGDPSVRREGHRWVMDFYGFDGEQAADGEAVTSDADFPLGWQRVGGGPVVAPSEPYDATFAHKPWVMTVGGRLFHYYTAVGADGRRQIALAVER